MIKTMKVKSGMGYIKDSKGKIVGKCRLGEGDHPLKEGYTYHEVKTFAKYREIVVPEPEKTPGEIIGEKIQSEMRALAVASLKAKGEIPQDYE